MSKVNFDKLIDLMGDDPEMLQEMLEVFLEDIPVMIQEVKQAWDSNQPENMKAPAHKLKSSITWLNLHDTHDSLVYLENFAKEGGNAEEAILHLNNAVTDCAEAIKAIEIKLQELK